MTKYTFLLPAYKGRFLDEMLRSIQGQTYTDFKVIISDDCSPEDLHSICEPYLSDPRFTYRRNEENMGSKSLVSHWNLLVDMCDTEYLILASDDDVYEPFFLEEIDSLVEKFPMVNLFRGRVQRIDKEGTLTLKDPMMDEFQSQMDFLYHFFCYEILKCIANYVFKTSVFKSKGSFYDLPLAWGSDDAAVVKMSEHGVCNTSSLSFSFRNSGINISTQTNKKIILEKTREIYNSILFLDDYLDRLKGLLTTKMEEEQFKLIEHSVRTGFYIKSISYGAQIASFKEMLQYFKYLSRVGYFSDKLDKIHFFWLWIRAHKI